MDEEDQCMSFKSLVSFTEYLPVHASRDKILLEGNDEGGDDDGDEDEVFGLKGLAEDSDDEELQYEDEDEHEEEDDDVPSQQPKKSKAKKGKGKGKESSESNDSDDSEEEETWGRNKSAYYSSNAAQLESDDDEANELEEQEARRLQTKARETMGEDDFGLGDQFEDAGNQDKAE